MVEPDEPGASVVEPDEPGASVVEPDEPLGEAVSRPRHRHGVSRRVPQPPFLGSGPTPRKLREANPLLATDRGISCALVDYDALRGLDNADDRLF